MADTWNVLGPARPAHREYAQFPRGRMGHESAPIHMASPAAVAASAVTSRIAGTSEL
jgi:homoaconitase/3-isopropylmalate dehydratase large subunit